MKRVFCFLLLAALLTLSVFATDNNDFFNDHAQECVYDGRDYSLNGPAGYVAVLDAPGGLTQDYLLNEQALTVFGVYRDASGALWAQLRYTPLGRGLAFSDVDGQRIGWASLSLLYRECDKEDFLADHAEEFVNRPLRLRLSTHPDTTLWVTPFSAEPCGYLRWYVSEEDALLSFPAWWRDAEGSRWALWEDSFICLDDPQRRENGFAAEQAVLYPAAAFDALPQVVEQPRPAEPVSYLPYYFLTGALVLGLLALIITIISKQERK